MSNNLVSSPRPEHKAAVKRLRAVLEKWIEESNDQGRVLEPAGTGRCAGRD